jgi:hypothetical protein
MKTTNPRMVIRSKEIPAMSAKRVEAWTKRGRWAWALAVALAASGCAEGGGGDEGERCNPALSHNECNDGLVCSQPDLCPENYCCPAAGGSSHPNCQTGCNGGAAAICTADKDPAACAFVFPDAGDQ